MKYIITVLGLLLITGCVHSSTTSAPVDIVGLWKGTVDKVIFGQPRELAFKFINDGQNVGGLMRNEARPDDWIKLENFKMKGDRIYFITTTYTPQGVIKVKYKGRLVDSEIKLATKVERPGSSDNRLSTSKPSFRYEGRSAGVTEGPSNIIDDALSGMEESKGTINGGDITFTIRKVQ